MFRMKQAIESTMALLIIASIICATNNSLAQEVAEIPFFSAPPGSAALGGGLRFGQCPYFASDNEDQRQIDLIPLYLYEGKYLFARGTKLRLVGLAANQ